MTNVRRMLVRVAVVVAGIGILSGCCVPVRGWGHGGRGHWDAPSHGRGEAPAPYPGDGGYPRRR